MTDQVQESQNLQEPQELQSLQEITKEEWEQLRGEVIQATLKTRKYPKEDLNWYYAKSQIKYPEDKAYFSPTFANFTYPKGYSSWTIRHFSQPGCRDLRLWAATPVTCLLRSPDGRHYTSRHLPGFCPIHDLIPASSTRTRKETK